MPGEVRRASRARQLWPVANVAPTDVLAASRVLGSADPLVWIGVNPITIYVGGRFIDFEAVAKLFVGGPVNAYLGRYGDLVLALTTLAFGLLFLRFLYRHKIFLRV